METVNHPTHYQGNNDTKEKKEKLGNFDTDDFYEAALMRTYDKKTVEYIMENS